METKMLLINGINFAFYEIEEDRLFLKLCIKIFMYDVDTENLYVRIIEIIEKREFSTVSYLNI